MLLALALLGLTGRSQAADPDLPASGHSRFDELISAGPVPFPFSRLLQRLERQLVSEPGRLAPYKAVLIPLGRSLQRGAGAPDFFRFPRVVVAVDGATRPGIAPLKDRLFIGYHEKGAVLEIISYNETLGRFEYQLVRDYRPGGKAELVYARRALCLACHQNAAPMFARPLWDETPANPAISARLKATGRDFYGVAIGGADLSYFFNNATDRANLLPVWQRIWREGCGDGAEGQTCRQALFLAALRLALSGVPPTPNRLAALAPQLDARWHSAWREGLAIPNPDLPNRDPLARSMESTAGPTKAQPEELARLPHILARFDPLNPRAPLEIWKAPDKVRLLSGLAGMFAATDLDALDKALARRPGREEPFDLDCQTRAKPDGRISFACQGVGLRLNGAIQSARGSGRVDRISLSGAPVGIELARLSTSRFQPRHGHRLARLADGRRLAELRIAEGHGRLTLVDDFASLAAVASGLPSLRASATFPAWDGMAELLTALGTQPTRQAAVALPKPHAEQAAALDAGPVGAFRRRCGMCHDTSDAAPPNFLHGDTAEVTARLAHCAPRIYYRLSMWEVAEARRGKTPMPPLPALAAFGFGADAWTRSPERRALLNAARGWLQDQGMDPAGIIRQSFESLPACLPATKYEVPLRARK
jgi:cytochrome c5